MIRASVSICVLIAASWIANDTNANCRRSAGCGGCSDPCATTACGGCGTISSGLGIGATGATAGQPIETGPVTELRIVMEPTYVTEKKSVCSTEYRDEERTRAVTVCKTVPVTEERVRVTTVSVPKTETKMLEYTVSVPVKEEKTHTYTLKVPVYKDVEETYAVKVPVLKDVPEEYKVSVPVLTDMEFTYTVNVPTTKTSIIMRTVTNAIPVVRTKTIASCVNSPAVTRTVMVDRGHWETRVVESQGMSGCGGRGCQPCSTAAPVCCKVWVPNCVAEEVTEAGPEQTVDIEYLVYEQQTTQVPYECSSIVYVPETRVGTRKCVTYKDELHTRPRTVVEYKDETRTRLNKVLTYSEESRTETYPIVSYKTEHRTKEVSFTVHVPESKTETYQVTRMDQVQEQKLEKYMVRVAVPVVNMVDVQVCKMVPKVVSVSINNPCVSGAAPCAGCAPGTPVAKAPGCCN